MQKESQTYKIAPADRLASVSEYYFSKKLKEVAEMNAAGKNVINLAWAAPTFHLRNRPSRRCVNMPAKRTSTVISRTWAYRNCVRDSPTGTRRGIT